MHTTYLPFLEAENYDIFLYLPAKEKYSRKNTILKNSLKPLRQNVGNFRQKVSMRYLIASKLSLQTMVNKLLLYFILSSLRLINHKVNYLSLNIRASSYAQGYFVSQT